MARDVVINDRSRQALAEINRLSNTALAEFAETTVEIAKRIHSQKRSSEATGNLGDSIASDNPSRRRFRVFTAVGYGGYQELGTSKMQAKPFLAPAIGATIREFQDGDKWGT